MPDILTIAQKWNTQEAWNAQKPKITPPVKPTTTVVVVRPPVEKQQPAGPIVSGVSAESLLARARQSGVLLDASTAVWLAAQGPIAVEEWFRSALAQGRAAAPTYGAPGYGVPGYGVPGYGVPGYGAPGGFTGPSYGSPSAPSAPVEQADGATVSLGSGGISGAGSIPMPLILAAGAIGLFFVARKA